MNVSEWYPVVCWSLRRRGWAFKTADVRDKLNVSWIGTSFRAHRMRSTLGWPDLWARLRVSSCDVVRHHVFFHV